MATMEEVARQPLELRLARLESLERGRQRPVRRERGIDGRLQRARERPRPIRPVRYARASG